MNKEIRVDLTSFLVRQRIITSLFVDGFGWTTDRMAEISWKLFEGGRIPLVVLSGGVNQRREGIFLPRLLNHRITENNNHDLLRTRVQSGREWMIK